MRVSSQKTPVKDSVTDAGRSLMKIKNNNPASTVPCGICIGLTQSWNHCVANVGENNSNKVKQKKIYETEKM